MSIRKDQLTIGVVALMVATCSNTDRNPPGSDHWVWINHAEFGPTLEATMPRTEDKAMALGGFCFDTCNPQRNWPACRYGYPYQPVRLDGLHSTGIRLSRRDRGCLRQPVDPRSQQIYR